MNFLIIIGWIAAIFTAATPIPQIIKAVKTKSTKDISLLMILFLLALSSLWTVYGIYLKDLPLTAGDGLSVVFCLVVLILKLKYDKKQ